MFDYLVVDSVLVGYLILNSEDVPDVRELLKMGDVTVYKGFIRTFIDAIEFIKNKFLSPEGEMILLFDNYESREQIKQLLKPLNEHESRKKINPAYKAQRRAEKYSFYASLEKIRYYYLISGTNYHTARIPNLEADDLVKPCLAYLREKKKDCQVLLVTNDSDWCRYIDHNTKWLPELYKEPYGILQFKANYGFEPSEEAIILNKIIYGDDADNIQCVFPELKGDIRKFIVRNFYSIADFMFSLGEHPETKEYVQLVKDREAEIRSAYQMLATIPVTNEHFRAVLTPGRESIARANMRKLFFNEETNKETGFEFGIQAPPRHMPKGN